MSKSESVQESRRHPRALFGGIALCLLLPLAVAEPPRGQIPATEQQAKLRDRDRHRSEAQKLHAAGNLAEAIAAGEKVLAIEREVLGSAHQEVADTLRWLAGRYEERDDFHAARKARRECLDMQIKQYGKDHRRTTEARLALAEVDLLEKLSREQRQRLREASSLLRQVQQLHIQGKAAEALPLAEKARAICQETYGVTHQRYGDAATRVGFLYESMGDYAKAEPLFRQASEIWKQTLGDKHPNYASSLNSLAAVYKSMGDYAKAEPLFRQASEIWKQTLGDKHPNYVTSLNNLASLYRTMGDYTKAEPLYRQALAIYKQVLGDKHPKYAQCLNNLAELYHTMGDYAKAETLYLQATAILKQVLGDTHRDYATSLKNLASLYKSMGDYAKAEPLYRQALAIEKTALSDKHPNYAYGLDHLALLYDAVGDYAKAEPLHRQALEVTRQSLQLTASVQSERQQLRMGDSLRFRLDNYLSAMVRAQAAAKLPSESTLPALYEHVLAWKGAVFMQQHRQRLARRHPELAALFQQLDNVSRRLATQALAVPTPQQRPAWQKVIGDLTDEKESLESKLANRCAAFDRDKQLARLTAKELQAVLPADAVLLDFLEYWHSKPDPKKKGKVPWKRHVAAFVVRRGRPLVLKDLGPVEDIAETIQSWRRVIARQGNGHGGVDPAGTLHRLLWQPLAESTGDAAVVVVSPDGVLGTFPFAALPGDKDDHYLIEERGVAVVAVPQLLPALLRPVAEDNKKVPPSLLLVGDVDFDAGAGKPVLAEAGRSAARGERQASVGNFHPLPGTRGEALAVRDSFEQHDPDAKVKLLRGKAATEDAFRREAPRHRYLHLATHGFFAPPQLKSALAPPDPKKRATVETSGGDALGKLGVSGYHPGLLSGLALAGANRESKLGEDDGILTALEVAALDLSGVESVVLSACETGLGQVAGGEGLLGLQRAFQVSGTQTVVASLWQVSDDWTRKLMERYYENLWQKKMPKLQALQEAQRWVMREGPKRGLDFPEEKPYRVASPYYWAAFVLSGDWR